MFHARTTQAQGDKFLSRTKQRWVNGIINTEIRKSKPTPDGLEGFVFSKWKTAFNSLNCPNIMYEQSITPYPNREHKQFLVTGGRRF